jgi:hypothetical protein
MTLRVKPVRMLYLQRMAATKRESAVWGRAATVRIRTADQPRGSAELHGCNRKDADIRCHPENLVKWRAVPQCVANV